MKRSPMPRARANLRQRSAKREREQRDEYLPLVRRLADESPWCEVGPRISAVARDYRGCTRRMQGLHHLRKQSQGGARCDPANVLRSCNACNGWVEDNPRLALEAGLVLRPGAERAAPEDGPLTRR